MLVNLYCILLLCVTLAAQTAPPACLEALNLHRQGQFDQAAAQYRRCLDAQPENFEARSNLAAVLVQLGQFEEAVTLYKQALEGAPAPALVPLHKNLALAYYKSGQIADAIRELSTVREAQPGDRNAVLLLADCFLVTGEPKKTVDLLDPFAATNDPAVDYLLGTALLRAGDLERGKVVIDRILKQSDSAEARLLLGVGMFQAGDYPGAVKEFARSVDLNPELPLAHSYLGQALLDTGDADGAVKAFRAELSLNPNDFDSNLRLGEILTVRKQLDAALPLLERAVRVRPASTEAHHSLAEADRNAGKQEDAKRQLAWLAGHGASATAAGTQQADGPPTGSEAPALTLTATGSDHPVTLQQFRGKSPVLLVFASYSCPQFRSQAAKLNDMFQHYGKKVPFLLVYIREAHAGSEWQSTINEREGIQVPVAGTLQQKRENAQLCLRKLNIHFSAAVDDIGGKAEAAYAAWPSRVFLINSAGRIVYQTRLGEQDFQAPGLEAALQAVR